MTQHIDLSLVGRVRGREKHGEKEEKEEGGE